MRELGRRSAKARSKPNPERVPTSLREELQKLDPSVVRGAIERALGGGNEAARVSAVKLLADVDAFRRDRECPDCAARAVEAEGAADKLDQRLLAVVVSVFRALLVTGEPAITDPAIVRLTLERIGADERLGPAAAFLASTRTIEGELESRTAELALERDQALARLSEFGA